MLVILICCKSQSVCSVSHSCLTSLQFSETQELIEWTLTNLRWVGGMVRLPFPLRLLNKTPPWYFFTSSNSFNPSKWKWPSGIPIGKALKIKKIIYANIWFCYAIVGETCSPFIVFMWQCHLPSGEKGVKKKLYVSNDAGLKMTFNVKKTLPKVHSNVLNM